MLRQQKKVTIENLGAVSNLSDTQAVLHVQHTKSLQPRQKSAVCVCAFRHSSLHCFENSVGLQNFVKINFSILACIFLSSVDLHTKLCEKSIVFLDLLLVVYIFQVTRTDWLVAKSVEPVMKP
jgi:hypothetical protein